MGKNYMVLDCRCTVASFNRCWGFDRHSIQNGYAEVPYYRGAPPVYAGESRTLPGDDRMSPIGDILSNLMAAMETFWSGCRGREQWMGRSLWKGAIR